MPRHDRSTLEGADAFRILTVCTGNICRSPLAEQLLRARLPEALRIGGAIHLDQAQLEVTSAGTIAQPGAPMEPQSAVEAVRLGVGDAAHHKARRLDASQVAGADLVLAMALEHRSASVRADPTALHRTFTLIELTRVLELLQAGDPHVTLAPLGDDGGPAFLRRVVAAAAAARGLLPRAATRHLDIDDPYGRSAAAYRRSADAVADHVDRLAVALAALARG